MRINCPVCGVRDLREFYYQGSAIALDRPEPDAGADAWDAYVHLRENSSGWHRELWHHEAGCGTWLEVERNVTTHEIRSVAVARKPS